MKILRIKYILIFIVYCCYLSSLKAQIRPSIDDNLFDKSYDCIISSDSKRYILSNQIGEIESVDIETNKKIASINLQHKIDFIFNDINDRINALWLEEDRGEMTLKISSIAGGLSESNMELDSFTFEMDGIESDMYLKSMVDISASGITIAIKKQESFLLFDRYTSQVEEVNLDNIKDSVLVDKRLIELHFPFTENDNLISLQFKSGQNYYKSLYNRKKKTFTQINTIDQKSICVYDGNGKTISQDNDWLNFHDYTLDRNVDIVHKDRLPDNLQEVLKFDQNQKIPFNFEISPGERYVSVKYLLTDAGGLDNETNKAYNFVIFNKAGFKELEISSEDYQNKSSMTYYMQWVNSRSIITSDYWDNIYLHDLIEPKLLKTNKEFSNYITLDIDENFDRIGYSGLGTGISPLTDSQQIGVFDSSTFYKYIDIDTSGGYTFINDLDFDQGQVQNLLTNSFDKLELGGFLSSINKSSISESKSYIKEQTKAFIHYNSVNTTKSDTINFDNYILKSSKKVGINNGNKQIYHRDLDNHIVGTSYISNPGSVITFRDLKDTSYNFSIHSNGLITNLIINSNGNYLTYHDSTDNQYVIFSLAKQEWISIPIQGKVEYHFFIGDSIAVSINNDEEFVLWNMNTGIRKASGKYKGKQIKKIFYLADINSLLINDQLVFDCKKNTIKQTSIIRNLKKRVSGYNIKLLDIHQVSQDGRYCYGTYTLFKNKKYPKIEKVFIADLKEEKIIFEDRIKVGPPARLFGGKDAFFHGQKPFVIIDKGSGMLKLINLTTKKLEATIKLLPIGEWIAITPEGKFDGTNNGRKALYYIDRNEVLLYDQIKERYWEDNLLERIINNPLKRIKDDPIISFPYYPKAAASFNDTTGIISVNITERNGGIGKISFRIDDQELDDNINPLNLTSFDIDLKSYPKDLYDNGTNKIEIITHNKDGWLSSRPITLYVKTHMVRDSTTKLTFAQAEESKDNISSTTTKPALLGLFVGASIYANEQLNLLYADTDAKALYRGFKVVANDTTMYNTKRNTFIKLTSDSDEKSYSSKENIMMALDSLAKISKKTDILFLSFSGHGVSLDEDFFFLTPLMGAQDITVDTITRRKATISAGELNEKFKNISARKKIMVLDACHSGAFRNILVGNTRSLNSSQERALEFLEDKNGSFIIASSEDNQKSRESQSLGQGLMTYSVLIGMKGEAAIDDELIRASELLNFAAKSTENISKQEGFPQLPVVFGTENGGHSFPFCWASDDIEIQSINDKIRMIKPQLINTDFDIKDSLEYFLNESLKEIGRIGSKSKILYTSMPTTNTYQIYGSYSIMNDTFDIGFVILKGQNKVSQKIKLKESNRRKLIFKIKNAAIKEIEKIKLQEEELE